MRLFARFVVLFAALFFGTVPIALGQDRGPGLIRDAEIENIIRDYSTPIFNAAGLDASAVEINLVNDPRLYDLYDYACYGDGDITLPALASALEQGQDVLSVPNLYFRDADGSVRFTFPQAVGSLKK